MPELPEVETVCRGLKDYVSGKTIICLVIRQGRLRYPVDTELVEFLANKVIRTVRRRAKYILLQLSDGTLVIHLGMSGTLSWRNKGDETVAKHDHISLKFEHGSLTYNDPRRFGCFFWTANIATHPLFVKLGPEPLTQDFDGNYLFKILRNKRQAAKLLIMNNSIVVGVGNIYATESLFASKISPIRKAQDLSLQECQLLANNIKKILHQAIAKGGTSLRDFTSVKGDLGYFVQQLQAYGRSGKECIECGTILIKIVLGQRNSVYCTRCQK